MVNTEQEKQQIDNLYLLLKGISEIAPESLVRKDALGDLNFEKAKPFFERNIELFKSLNSCDLYILPESAAIELIDVSQRFLNEMDRVKAFSLQENNAPNLAHEYFQRAQTSYQEYFSIVTKYLPYLRTRSSDIDHLRDELQKDATNAKKIISDETETLKNYTVKVQKETGELLDSIKNVAAEAGVSKHATVFADEAKQHDGIAKIWLGVTVIIALVTAAFTAYSIYFYSDSTINLSVTQNTQLAIAKIIGFSLLFYSLKLANKNYTAHRHNQVTNKHRQNALSTFEAFVKASGDSGTKDAVLLRSTETIFSSGVTGYLLEDKDNSTNTQILEVFRNIPKTGS